MRNGTLVRQAGIRPSRPHRSRWISGFSADFPTVTNTVGPSKPSASGYDVPVFKNTLHSVVLGPALEHDPLCKR